MVKNFIKIGSLVICTLVILGVINISINYRNVQGQLRHGRHLKYGEMQWSKVDWELVIADVKNITGNEKSEVFLMKNRGVKIIYGDTFSGKKSGTSFTPPKFSYSINRSSMKYYVSTVKKGERTEGVFRIYQESDEGFYEIYDLIYSSGKFFLEDIMETKNKTQSSWVSIFEKDDMNEKDIPEFMKSL